MTPPEQLNLRLETNLASQDKDTRELGRIKPSLGSVINFALWPVVREKMHCYCTAPKPTSDKIIPVAIRTGLVHRSVFAIHTGSSFFLKFI